MTAMYKTGAIILLAAAAAHAHAHAEPAAITTLNGAQETQINYDLSIYNSKFRANPTFASIIAVAISDVPTSALEAYEATLTGYGYSEYLSFINEPTHTIDTPPFVTYIPESLRSKYLQLYTSYQEDVLSIQLSDVRDTTGYPALSAAETERRTGRVTRTAAIPTMPSFTPIGSETLLQGPSSTAASGSMSTSSSTGGAPMPTARAFYAHAVGVAAGAIGAAAVFL